MEITAVAKSVQCSKILTFCHMQLEGNIKHLLSAADDCRTFPICHHTARQ